MAKIVWDFQNYVYTRGVDTLKRGYRAARDALHLEIKRIEDQLLEYTTALTKGGAWIGELDDDGFPLWDQAQIYDFELDDVQHALHAVRKAFIIALYHHWEHCAAGWRDAFGSHFELAEYCKQQGYGPSPHLDAVRHVVNYFKHGNNSRNDWLDDLRSKYPAFMPSEIGLPYGLTDEDVDEVASIILASGPPDPNAGR